MNNNPYLRLMRVDKPVGTLLLLFPTLIALFIASEGTPSFLMLVIFTLGVFITRAAGCVINDIFDRKIDGNVARTKDRPIANKEISVFKALLVFFALVALGVLLLIGFLPSTTYGYAFASAILLALYPLSKRYIKIPQVVLGLAFSMPIPMVYAALGLNPFVSITAWLLFIGNFLWVLAYDTNYAITDLDDDLKQPNVNSSAIFFGEKVNNFVLIFNTLYLVTLVVIGVLHHFTELFYILLAINAVIFLYQYFTVDREVGETGFVAFKQNIQVGLVTLLAVILGLIGTNHQKYLDTKAAFDSYVQKVEGVKPAEPKAEPEALPKEEPVVAPVEEPKSEPATAPAEEPEAQPKEEPATAPAEEPKAQPKEEPSTAPAEEPKDQPKEDPVTTPTEEPKTQPKEEPATSPAEEPKVQPEVQPKEEPTTVPAKEPKEEPTVEPQVQPKNIPEIIPEDKPAKPLTSPSAEPDVNPEAQPQVQPENQPEVYPGKDSNPEPKTEPMVKPNTDPLAEPKVVPSEKPTTPVVPSDTKKAPEKA